MEQFKVINGYVLENGDKLERVISGVLGRDGALEGGLGEDAEPATVLAHYDRIAGYITKDGVKIKTGSFWDVKGKCPRKEPDVMYIFKIGGEIVEVDDPKNLADAISTVEKVKTEKEEKVKAHKAKSKFKE